MTIQPKRVSFYSDGCQLAGLLFLPRNDRPSPGIVFSQGTVGMKEHYRYPELAAAFADAGYASLIFDYRGFGESEGSKNRIMPLEQAQDVRSALSFLEGQPEVDPDRLGLMGFCWGGTHSVYVGGVDSRVRCVAEVVGIANGRRWLRNLRRYWEWQEFLERLEADRQQRVVTGSSEIVRMGEVLIGSPMAKEGRRKIKEEIAPASPPYKSQDVTLESAEHILEYRPEDVIGKLSPRPVLIVHAAEDDLVPLEEAKTLYEAADDPKKMIVYPNAYHHDVYFDPIFTEIVGHSIEWFRKWLPSED